MGPSIRRYCYCLRSIDLWIQRHEVHWIQVDHDVPIPWFLSRTWCSIGRCHCLIQRNPSFIDAMYCRSRLWCWSYWRMRKCSMVVPLACDDQLGRFIHLCMYFLCWFLFLRRICPQELNLLSTSRVYSFVLHVSFHSNILNHRVSRLHAIYIFTIYKYIIIICYNPLSTTNGRPQIY